MKKKKLAKTDELQYNNNNNKGAYYPCKGNHS